MSEVLLTSLATGSLALRAGLARMYPRPAPDLSLSNNILTVVTAVLGGDPGLRARLAGTRRALPDQAFLYLVDQDDAEGLGAVQGAIAAVPDPATRVVTCPPCPSHLNPKVWKLVRAAVATPYLAVLDDDTLLERHAAAALVHAAATPNTIATGIPCYEPDGPWPSALLAQFVDNQALTVYLGTACLMEPPSLNGMGYVLASSTLERLGGFEPILDCLTDDLALARHARNHGVSLHQVAAPLLLRTHVRDARHLASLLHRWCVFTVLLLREVPRAVALTLVGLHGLPPFLLWALLLRTLWHPDPMAALCLGGFLVLRALALVHLHRRFYGRSCHRPLVSLVAELMQPLHVAHAMMVRTIQWRGHRYQVRGMRDFQEVP